ncbi:MAG: HNH endonuclease [Spirochaetia bacterium]|jgi:hypothetical protein|nr:HNH endonuclease [Spirochaetia bacterium]
MQIGKAPVGLDSKPLELHHIKPLSLNGTNHYSNLKIMTQSDHRLGKNMYRNHPDIYKLRKARYSSFKAVRNTLKYAPYAAAVASVFEVGFILNKHGFAEAFNKKEFYREITTAGAGIGSGVLASKLSAPVCIGAGTAGTPAAGAVCVVLLSVAGYYIGEKAGSQVFDIVFGKEKINEDIAKMKKAIHDEIYKTKVMPTKNK